MDTSKTCPICEGRGSRYTARGAYACEACGGTGRTDSPLTGIYRKLAAGRAGRGMRGGEWGVQVTSGAPKVGAQVTVTKRSGERKIETIASVIDGNLCSIVATPREPRIHVTRFNSGAVVYQNARGRCEDAPCCGCCS